MTGERFRLRPRAEADLEAILLFGVERWGLLQAEAYLRRFGAAFEQLADTPKLGQERVGLAEPIRTLFVGTHVVVYRDDEPIDIVRVMHQSSDWSDLKDL